MTGPAASTDDRVQLSRLDMLLDLEDVARVAEIVRVRALANGETGIAEHARFAHLHLVSAIDQLLSQAVPETFGRLRARAPAGKDIA